MTLHCEGRFSQGSYLKKQKKSISPHEETQQENIRAVYRHAQHLLPAGTCSC